MMFCALMPSQLVIVSIDDVLIELDDYQSGCMAVYAVQNPQRKELICYLTDEGKNKNSGPRCDYLLLNIAEETSRYIELKGNLIQIDGKKQNTWEHGFEQLFRTYEEYGKNFNKMPDKVFFRFVTSFRGTLPRYTGYDYYVRLKLLGYEVAVMQPGDEDII